MPDTTPEPNPLEVQRAEGKEELEASLRRLELELYAVQSKLRTYRNGCPTATDVVRPRGCGLLEMEIRELLDDIDRSVAAAEEKARRSWVQPGTQRDILREYQLDSASRGRMRRETESALR
jgi:hypothetical protein